MGDWPGTGVIALRLREYKSFSNARFYVRPLKLTNRSERQFYCTSGKKQVDIPATPRLVYKIKLWKGMGD